MKKITVPSILYYNIVSESIYNMEDFNNIKKLTQTNDSNLIKIIFRQSTNKGKDIGGKLLLIDSYQKLNVVTGYGLFLHDKKSIYKANNIIWANELFKIVEPAFQQKAFRLLKQNKSAGIIAGSGSLINEYNESLKIFVSTNNTLLIKLQNQYKISPNNFQYVAGTMFWFRMQPINNFFRINSPLKIRESLEYGNITDQYSGSHTHCWERLLSWIITSQNFKINII